MKRMVAALFALLLAPVLAVGENSTISFDSSLLSVDTENGRFVYQGLESITLGLELSLPAEEYYIDLSRHAETPKIDFSVSSRTYLGTIDARFFADIPTSNDPERAQSAISARQTNLLGHQPVCVTTSVHNTNEQGARVLIFPVTVEPDGNCYFNESINITIGTELLSADALSEYRDDLYENDLKLTSTTSTLAGTAVCRIVASATLAEAVRPLAEYRNAMGIATDIVIIDNILDSYSGRDDAEKLREHLKEFYANGGQYVLLCGDETQLPIRYSYPWNQSVLPSLEYMQICDLYFADLTGDWNADNDLVWGERYVDGVDLVPELLVGRLPFNAPIEVTAWIDKLIAYETNPGAGQSDYLERTFFFCGDQMRDYDQHGAIAEVYPDYFQVDTVNGVEQASGEDLNPYNQTGNEVEAVLSEGYGIVNIIDHGTTGSFAVRTAGYNEWPKSYFTTNSTATDDGLVGDLESNGKTSFYYALSCDVGGFDMDQPPFNATPPNMVQTALSLENAGAVAFIANSREGWVSCSYLYHRAFFDSLFAHPERPAVSALYAAKIGLPYYLDQIYGLNYFGDPTFRPHLRVPGMLAASTSFDSGNLMVTVTADSLPVAGCEVILSKDGVVLERATTNGQGSCVFTEDLLFGDDYTICALAEGFAVYHSEYTPTLTTDVDDPSDELPSGFALHQNYPNPFNPSTAIVFDLSRGTTVRLTVVNILGQEVKTLADGYFSAGKHELVWGGDDYGGHEVASGVYFYRLRSEKYEDIRKMLLVR